MAYYLALHNNVASWVGSVNHSFFKEVLIPILVSRKVPPNRIRKYYQTVDAEVKVAMDAQRACDAENQAESTPSNGPQRAPEKAYAKYRAT